MPTCTSCGFESGRAFRFCPECGTEPPLAAPSREQRKTVTVVFCDLAGSTAMGESLDPERLRARCQELCRQPGLPDARLSDERDELAVPGDRLLPGILKDSELALATDELRIVPTLRCVEDAWRTWGVPSDCRVSPARRVRSPRRAAACSSTPAARTRPSSSTGRSSSWCARSFTGRHRSRTASAGSTPTRDSNGAACSLTEMFCSLSSAGSRRHELLAASAELVAERRAAMAHTGLELRRFDVTMLAGEPAAANAAARAAYEARQAADVSNLMWWCCSVARALLELGRDAEADGWLTLGRERWPSPERIPQMQSRQIEARLLARRGEHVEAERLARDAAALGDETDMLNAQGDAYADLGEVLSLGGKPTEAAAAVEEALERYERKGNLVMAERVRARLAELRGGAPP